MIVEFNVRHKEALLVKVGEATEEYAVEPEWTSVFRVKATRPFASLLVEANYLAGKGGWDFTVLPDDNAASAHPDWPVRRVESPEGRTASVFIDAPEGTTVTLES